MSAIPQRGPHVRDLFVQPGPSVGVAHLEADNQESRANYALGSKKKRPAPPPPAGLGHYKPKILSGTNDSNITISQATAAPADARHTANGRGPESKPTPLSSNNNNRPFIIGDKDTPLVLHAASDDHYSAERDICDQKVSATSEADGAFMGTSNPLFDAQSPKVNLANGHAARDDQREERKGRENGEPDRVFIPRPDYDEDEKIMVFSDEPDDDDDLLSEQPGKKVYKEYDGEDFAQYLSDEEIGTDNAPTWHKRSSHAPDWKSKTEAKRTLYKKREPSTLPGKTNGKKDKSFPGPGSVRNFSYADSKYGTLNGGSSSKRASVHSLSELDTGEAELFVNTGSSYEHFLCSKNGEELPPVLSEVPQVPFRYTRPAHKKDTLWKKLTWRFKNHAKNGFDVESS
ncbi:hypothetical protein ACOMHN_001642 [Nucella lapillus]